MEHNKVPVVAAEVSAEGTLRIENYPRHASLVRRVYRLRDACAALQLSLLACEYYCRNAPSTVATYMEAGASDLVKDVLIVHGAPSSSSPTGVSSSDTIATSPASWFCIGPEAGGGGHAYLLLPTYADYFYDYTMYWARIAYSEMARQYVGFCLIAKLLTVGGGWASLHRADRSLVCALQLYAVAKSVYDDEVVHKCRLFVGWAYLWNSNPTKALEVFRAELAAARQRGHTLHERRCLHAIENAKRNPRLAPGGKHTGRYQLVDIWSGTLN
ncbi:hypothetical protein JKF63_04779 [Porcisia hertigi]|uniref:Uncharacterized protein n=1 Tax=Porcisia hertigi TaxID=2761500 RepID=A0A836LA67_9TRYP|nr:hypothetical protein JKF63_04779 [Porcisia hertigi]